MPQTEDFKDLLDEVPDVFNEPFDTIQKYLTSLEGVFYTNETTTYLWYYRSPKTRHITEMIEQQKPPRHGGRNAQNYAHPYKRSVARLPSQQTTYNPYYPQMKQQQQYQQQSHLYQQQHQPHPFHSQYIQQQHYYKPHSQHSQFTSLPVQQQYQYYNQPTKPAIHQPVPQQQMQRKPFHSSANSCYFKDNNQYRINRQYLSEPSLTAPARSRSNSSLGSASSTHGGRAYVDHRPAYLYDYQLLGDDFFLSLALNDLSATLVNDAPRFIKRSGLCISGQTIGDAANYVAKLLNPIDDYVIVNIGSVDLLHGREFADMKCDFERLLAAFQSRHIQPVITTLAPLANHGHEQDTRRKWTLFNAYLLKEFPSHVLDITSCFTSGNGQTLHDCYQPLAKYVSGSSRPHALWNRVGRQRVLGLLKRQVYEMFDVIDR